MPLWSTGKHEEQINHYARTRYIAVSRTAFDKLRIQSLNDYAEHRTHAPISEVRSQVIRSGMTSLIRWCTQIRRSSWKHGKSGIWDNNRGLLKTEIME